MTATQLIQQLQQLVQNHGDREIEVNGEYNNDSRIDTASRLPVTRADMFSDSDNFQIMIDNSL